VSEQVTIDQRFFRDVLGCYPTGVSVITSLSAEGEKLAMVVGTFTSISLDPPLVGFFPDKRSSSWPKIEATGRFCVNVLASHQSDLSGRLSARDGDRFSGLEHDTSPLGLPLLRENVAWIDCCIAQTIEVGDHWLVVGAVQSLGSGDTRGPLMFHRGGYHTLASLG
jgi:3-hydroxy-9,10-secoandrosta-1,3,5(10)-triene-9,17-dione monooxygenase reductase component